MAGAHDPPDYDEPPPPSYDESQSTTYNPIVVPSSGQSCNRISSITTGPHQPQPSPSFLPSSPIHPVLFRPPILHGDRRSSSSASATANIPTSLTGLYHNVLHQQRPPSTLPISGGYYQTIHIPRQQGYYQYVFESHRRHRRRRVVDSSERRFPIAAIFFLFGWLCPPLWVIGACCCSGSRNQYESWWGKANFIMAVMFIFSSIAYSMIALSLGDWTVGLRILSLSSA